jgi:Mn-dependent DtxR family transcriptional regulator
MNWTEEVLLESAVENGEIELSEIASRMQVDGEELAGSADAMIKRGLFDLVVPGVCSVTERGRRVWRSVLAAEREEVVRRAGLR